MANLIRTPIVDSTGKSTHVWKGGDKPSLAPNRLSGISAAPTKPVIRLIYSEDDEAFAEKSWNELTTKEKTTRVDRRVVNLLDEHGLLAGGWDFATHRSHKKLGECDYSKKTISISTVLIEHASEAEVEDTVLHEVAHAIAGSGAGHTARWKAVARSIGHSGETNSGVVNLPPAPGGKKAAFIPKLDDDGNVYQYEVPVYIGDKILWSDGEVVTVVKINQKKFLAQGTNGWDYAFYHRNAERYRADYLARYPEESEKEG